MKKTSLILGIFLLLLGFSCNKNTITRNSSLLTNKAWRKGLEIIIFYDYGDFEVYDLHVSSDGDFVFNDTTYYVYDDGSYNWNWSEDKIQSINLFQESSSEIVGCITIVNVSKDELITKYNNDEVHYQNDEKLYEALKEYFGNSVK